jgi:wyosine [tRNA(Phe)-imidazoG37] synthetase (radical SAM superfamily)
VREELEHFFAHNPDPEYITFSGAGEPTLHSRIGEVIIFLKTIRPHIPVAVLTNSSLLGDPVVRKELESADVVLPSLDAATAQSFRKINRPPGWIKVEAVIDGLIEFGKKFRGEIWLAVLILPGYNNDPVNLEALRDSIIKIDPHRIQLNTLDRPGTIKGLRPASRHELGEIALRWDFENLEIILPPEERKQVKSYRTDVENAIIETLTRRPCTLGDLKKILGIHINEINKYLGTMEESGMIETIDQERGTFYKLK